MKCEQSATFTELSANMKNDAANIERLSGWASARPNDIFFPSRCRIGQQVGGKLREEQSAPKIRGSRPLGFEPPGQPGPVERQRAYVRSLRFRLSRRFYVMDIASMPALGEISEEYKQQIT